MVYDWDGKRDICYKMYIEDKKALEEIMEYMKVCYQFAPSKRAFQTQFKRWGFPSKQNPAHKNEGLVARIKELWERNTSQRDMLRILNEEGYEIKERELMRVRAKNRWLLRVPNGMRAKPKVTTAITSAAGPTTAAMPGQLGSDESLLALQQEAYKPDGSLDSSEQQFAADLQAATQQRPPSPALSPEILAKRKERMERLQAESEERWAARKRRRRTRGWGGLPADPPGPPRFPSETTLDESKQYLSLDNDMYRELRDHFQHICEEAGFIKKTVAGPEKWQAAKDRLIHESSHLQMVFWSNSGQMEAKALALDVVCTDVTKRMRTLQRRMTIADAKNALGINPEESRQIRDAFYQTLKVDHFTSKLEAGDEHWSELKEKWIQGSELLQKILGPGEMDPNHSVKVKALEILCRDVNKRLRDEMSKRDPFRKRSSTSNNANDNNPSGRAQSSGTSSYTRPSANSPAIPNGISTLASQALASTRMMSGDISDLQIDPSLLQAANNTSFALDPTNHHRHDHDHNHQHNPHNPDHHHQSPTGEHPFGYVDPMLDTALMPIPVYLRIHPQSQVYHNAKTWLDKLTTRTLAELQSMVTSRFKDVNIVRIEGTEKEVGNGNQNGNGNSAGRESVYVIDEDHELDAYLTHVQGRKATFVFLLERG
ncbi:hypothetical protein PABG_01206 [Paracoccidioides brasiliensis Pb03]|nr:hypothetical protein PABG_01206 [Paracoccidioides brasiliensis Pb03]